MFNRKQRPPEPREDRAPPAAARRRRHPSENGEVYVESIGANVPPVPGSNTTDGNERIAHMARDVLDRVRHSIRGRRAAPTD